MQRLFNLAKTSLLCVSLLMAGNCFAENKVTIQFLNWAEYITPDIIPNFTAKTGINVQQNYFDSDYTLKGILLAGDSGYDLALPASVTMQSLIEANQLTPLDKSKLPNYKYIDPSLYKITADVDTHNQYGIIYDYGTTGIAYNVDMVRKVLGPNVNIDSWDFLLNPKYLKKLQSCGVSFLDDPGQVLGVTLFYLGLDPNSTNPKDLRKAANYVMMLRPYLTYFDNTRYITDLASGNICLAMGYSGDVLRAEQEAQQANANIHLKYILPKEGAPIWFDMLVIPKNAPHPEAALAFINYLLNPKVAADLSNYLYQPNAIPASKPYLNAALQDPNVSPTPEMMKKLFNIYDPPISANDLINRLWFEIRYDVSMSN